MFESQLLDRDYYRKEKLHRNKESGNRVEKLENQMKSDHEKRLTNVKALNRHQTQKPAREQITSLR